MSAGKHGIVVAPTSLSGLRVLELRAAVFGLTEDLVRRIRPDNSKTISTVGARSFDEQQLVGLAHVLEIVYPFAIELALKSLWYALHAEGTHSETHHLGDLFRTLPDGATDVSDAMRAQDEARFVWAGAQGLGSVSRDHGTLDEFLDARAADFLKSRYEAFDGSSSKRMVDYRICFDTIVIPLANRDPQTFSNLEDQPLTPGDSLRWRQVR